MRSSHRIRFTAWLILSLVALSNASAQTTSAQITGRITDATGSVMPGVRVVTTHTDTEIRRETTSNELGYFTLAALPPGQYRMVLQKEGFKPVSRTGLSLEVNQSVRLDFAMEVGSVSDRVEVTGEAPQIERESAALGAVIENRKIVDIPLNAPEPVAWRSWFPE